MIIKICKLDETGHKIEGRLLNSKDQIPNGFIIMTDDEERKLNNGWYKDRVTGELKEVPPHVPSSAKLLQQAQNSAISSLKARLTETDYKCLKFADGALTDSEYAATRDDRVKLRAAINDIEVAQTTAEVEQIMLNFGN